MFVYWYLMRFGGDSPFSHSALDIKTYAMALIQKDYRDSVKKNMPKEWFDAMRHTMWLWTMRLSKAHSSAICSRIAARPKKRRMTDRTFGIYFT